jgi:uncharacterized OB-fold protein
MSTGADRDSQPWWEALGRGELLLQVCGACRTFRWPPRAMCNRCGSLDWGWQAACGRGAVASWIVNRHAFLPGFDAPYVVVLVRLEEQDDLLLPGGWAGSRDGDDLRIGLPVVAGFDQDEARLRWRLG